MSEESAKARRKRISSETDPEKKPKSATEKTAADKREKTAERSETA